MTAQFPPDTQWDERKADNEWRQHRLDSRAVGSVTNSVSQAEYDKLRELRNECLNEVPIKLNQIAERLRLAVGPMHNELANELQQYGLKLKRLAEEAR